MTQETQAGQNQEQDGLQPPKAGGTEDNMSPLPGEEQEDEGTPAEQASVSTGAPLQEDDVGSDKQRDPQPAEGGHPQSQNT